MHLCSLAVFLVFFKKKIVKLIAPRLKDVIFKNLQPFFFDRYCHEVLKPCFIDWETGPKWRSMTLLQPGLIFLLHHHHQRLFVLFIKLLMQENFPFLFFSMVGAIASSIEGLSKEGILTQMFCTMWEFCPSYFFLKKIP